MMTDFDENLELAFLVSSATVCTEGRSKMSEYDFENKPLKELLSLSNQTQNLLDEKGIMTMDNLLKFSCFDLARLDSKHLHEIIDALSAIGFTSFASPKRKGAR
jgi:hypothetical protein